MIPRRQFLAASLAIPTLTDLDPGPDYAAAAGRWLMPHEGSPHRCTWMAFGANGPTWNDELLPLARRNLADIARTVARFEPVRMLVDPAQRETARALCGDSVTLVDMPLDSPWIRDAGPGFVLDREGKLGGVDLNFNGWGARQPHAQDARLAAALSARAGAEYLRATLVAEGGGIEVDGQGTAIVTESCVVNPNRNPGLNRQECELALKSLFGLHEIVWLPGIRGQDMSDGQTDFYVRFAAPGVVLVHLESDPLSSDHALTREHLRLLRGAHDAQGRRLQMITLDSPWRVRPGFESGRFAASYAGYYVANSVVVAPRFGDRRRDARCREVLATLFPSREVVQLEVDALAAGGGGIHGATVQQPATGP